VRIPGRPQSGAKSIPKKPREVSAKTWVGVVYCVTSALQIWEVLMVLIGAWLARRKEQWYEQKLREKIEVKRPGQATHLQPLHANIIVKCRRGPTLGDIGSPVPLAARIFRQELSQSMEHVSSFYMKTNTKPM